MGPYSQNRDSSAFSHARSVYCLFLTQLFLEKDRMIFSHVNVFRVNWRIVPLTSTLWVPSHVSGLRCVFAQTHESERDALRLLSLSLSWVCTKTQRNPDTWDGTLTEVTNRESRQSRHNPGFHRRLMKTRVVSFIEEGIALNITVMYMHVKSIFTVLLYINSNFH